MRSKTVDRLLKTMPKDIKHNTERKLKIAEFDDLLAQVKKLQADPSLPFDFFEWKLYFPELIKKNKREIIQHVGELPEFTDKMSDEQKMKICKTVFNRLNDREHPVRVNLFYMSSIPEIAIIEGKNENN